MSVGLALRLLVFAGTCGLIVSFVARRTTMDRWVQSFVALNFCLVLGLGLALYLASAASLPMVESLIWRPGFFTFAPGAAGYDDTARLLAAALRYDVPFPDHHSMLSLHVPVWSLVLGMLYRIIGDHPLAAVVFNAMLASLTVLLVSVLATKFRGPAAARISAGVIALWPSAVLWATQILKDALSLALLAAALCSTALLLQASTWRAREVRALLVGLVLSIVFLFFVRDYLVVGLAVTMAVLVLVGVLGKPSGVPVGRAVVLTAIVGLLATTLHVAEADVRLYRALSPYGPAAARFESGVIRQAEGGVDSAIREYRAAVVLNDRFWPAWYNLGFASLEQGDLATAREALHSFLTLIPRDPSSPVCPTTPCSKMEAERSVRQFNPTRVYSPVSPTARPAVQAFIDWIDDALALPPAQRDPVARQVRRAAVTMMIRAYPTVMHTGRTATQTTHPSSTSSTVQDAPAPNWSLPQVLGDLRRGSIHVHGGLEAANRPETPLVLADDVPERPGWFSIAAWSRAAVTSVLFAPYPWDWWRSEGLGASVRVLAGIESLGIALLLPLAVVGGLTTGRSSRSMGLLLFILFLVLALGIGLTTLNVGTLFRLRLSALLPLFVLVGVGWAKWHEERA